MTAPRLFAGLTLEENRETAEQSDEQICAARILRALLDAPEFVRLDALAIACRVFIEGKLPEGDQ